MLAAQLAQRALEGAVEIVVDAAHIALLHADENAPLLQLLQGLLDGFVRTDIPAISAKVLSARLKELEAIGIIDRTVQPTSPPSVEYELTDLGRELIPAIQAIASVGRRLKNVPA